MNHQKSKLFVLIMFICMGLINCGKKEEKTELGGIVELRWVSDANPIRQQQIELFEKLNPGIKINLDWSSLGLQKVLTQIAGGTPPDLLDIYEPEQFSKIREIVSQVCL